MSDIFSKYRPKKIEDFVAGETQTLQLQNILDNPSTYHVYLIHGPSGIGKTSFARIFARHINKWPEDMDILKCQEYQEINCADNRKIDDAREWLTLMKSRPLTAKYRVIVLDEAHQLTDAAQNTILKGMEDVPETNYIFICSTNPAGLLNTIRTRSKEISLYPSGSDFDNTNSLFWSKLTNLSKAVSQSEGNLTPAIKMFLDGNTPETFSLRRFVTFIDEIRDRDISLYGEDALKFSNFNGGADPSQITNFLVKQMIRFAAVKQDTLISDFPFVEQHWHLVAKKIDELSASSESVRMKILWTFAQILSEEKDPKKRYFAANMLDIFTRRHYMDHDGRYKFLLDMRNCFDVFRKMSIAEKMESK